jgi:hypothetical protein
MMPYRPAPARALAVLFAFGLAAGAVSAQSTPPAASPGPAPIAAYPVTDFTAEKFCRMAGGRIDVYPFTGHRSCNPAAPDAGTPCRLSADCVGYCVAETRLCSSHVAMGPGCHSFYDDDPDTPVTLCVD